MTRRRSQPTRFSLEERTALENADDVGEFGGADALVRREQRQVQAGVGEAAAVPRRAEALDGVVWQRAVTVRATSLDGVVWQRAVTVRATSLTPG